MADVRHLVFAILKFLDDQQRSPDLSPDAIESLEVATQCLESAYGLTIRDVDAAQRYTMPAALPMIFAAGLAHLMQVPEASVAEREAAEKLKTEGNELMKQEMYNDAIDSYTRAIETDGRNAVYYGNRAAAYGKLGDHQKSIADCRRALELDPKYGKAFGRMGLAYAAMGRHAEARQNYQKAMLLDPTNETYRENLKHAEQCLREDTVTSGSAGAVPGGLGGLNLGGLGGLDLSSLLSNPALMNMATSMLSNPQMQQMMANMMSGAGGGPAASAPGAAPGISNLLQAGQQLAQQMQQSNPELVEQLRSQMRTQSSDDAPHADAPHADADGQSPPDDTKMGDS